MTNFYLWKIDTRKEFELPYNKVTDLGFKVLELCLEDIEQIDVPKSSIALEQYDNSKYKISKNDFAKIDYIAYMYFCFRAFLCVSEPRDFVEEHDNFFQWALIHYANTQLNLSREDVATLLQKRFETYDSIVAEAPEKTGNDLMQQFVIYLERDFLENPLGNEYPLISLFEETNLKLKVNQHMSDLIGKLLSSRESINEVHKTSQVAKETRKPQKVHNTFRSQKEKRKSQKESLKEKSQGALGFLGIVLYYLIRIFIAILPFVMIGANFIVTLILISVEMFIPLTSIVFWIWGFVCAIMGKQDFLAIMYYIVFAVAWLPFYIQIIKSLFRK